MSELCAQPRRETGGAAVLNGVPVGRDVDAVLLLVRAVGDVDHRRNSGAPDDPAVSCLAFRAGSWLTPNGVGA